MITITPAASEFIQQSLENSDDTSLALRVATYPDLKNNCYTYKIGFDQETEDDLVIDNSTFKVLIHSSQREFLEDATLDYVELEEGVMNLIVMNPNDPSYVPPKKDKLNKQ